MNGWSAHTELLPDGVLLTVTASDPAQVRHIRWLGFIGLLVSGSHHRRIISAWPRANSPATIELRFAGRTGWPWRGVRL